MKEKSFIRGKYSDPKIQSDFEDEALAAPHKIYVLIIYDIVSTKRRNKLVKFLQGYGVRVQKSAFEAIVQKRQYREILQKIGTYLDGKEDSIRIYRIPEEGGVKSFGIATNTPKQRSVILL